MSTWEDEYEAFCESEEDEDEDSDEGDYEEPDDRYSFEAFDPLSQSIVVHRG